MTKIEEDISPLSGITLWVLSQNQRAIAFYRKIGYEFDGAEKSLQLAGVSLREVRLRKDKPNKAWVLTDHKLFNFTSTPFQSRPWADI